MYFINDATYKQIDDWLRESHIWDDAVIWDYNEYYNNGWDLMDSLLHYPFDDVKQDDN